MGCGYEWIFFPNEDVLVLDGVDAIVNTRSLSALNSVLKTQRIAHFLKSI